jgi:hypothetical protein
VILLAVRWHQRYFLSYRDVRELLAKRGIAVDHVTIYRWQGRADTISCRAIALPYYQRVNPQLAAQPGTPSPRSLPIAKCSQLPARDAAPNWSAHGAAHAT